MNQPKTWRDMRGEIERWLLVEKGFSPVGARACAESFIQTMEFAEIPYEGRSIGILGETDNSPNIRKIRSRALDKKS